MDMIHLWMHEAMVAWFEFVRDWEYVGVFILMAMESTIIPIPSEVVMPPAGYWAAKGEMNMAGVVLAGGLGSTFGSALTYAFTFYFGRAVVERWGKYMLLPPARLALAEQWLATYQTGGVFFARLLPVVRHLIGFPAGLVRMPFGTFCLVTFIGSTLWCGILAAFGAETIGAQEDLLKDPSAMVKAVKDDLIWFVVLVAGLGTGWLFVKWFGSRKASSP